MTRRSLALVTLVLAASCDQGKRTQPQPGSAAAAPTPVAQPAAFTWLTNETAAFEQARTEGKAVVVDITAQWATPSTELDLLLADPQITAQLAPHFVGLRIEDSDDSDATAPLRERYGASTLPFVRFVDTDGTVLATITSLPSPDELRATIDKAIAQRRRATGSGAAPRPMTACPLPDPPQLDAAVEAQRAALVRCVEQSAAAHGSAGIPSSVDATFELDPNGTVASASVTMPGGGAPGSTIDHRLETCLIDMLLELRLPARHCPDRVTVRYPLRLSR